MIRWIDGIDRESKRERERGICNERQRQTEDAG